jgi:hypothetical protein
MITLVIVVDCCVWWFLLLIVVCGGSCMCYLWWTWREIEIEIEIESPLRFSISTFSKRKIVMDIGFGHFGFRFRMDFRNGLTVSIYFAPTRMRHATKP